MRYRFTRSVVCDGVARKDGDEIGESEFAAGSLEPCLRMGHVAKIEEPAPDALAVSKAAKKSKEE